jgi:hypothetical protein
MKKQLALVAAMAGLFAGSANALIIDDFSTNQSIAVTAAAISSASNNVVGGGMISADRDMTLNKTAGPSGGANGVYADVAGGLLGIANGPVTNSNLHVLWDGFSSTNLTSGGATGFFMSLPNAIDNTLIVDFIINGNASSITKTFLNGASGSDFFFAFNQFSNSSVFTAVNSIEMVLRSNGVAWDAQVDLVETRDTPPSTSVPEPATLGLLGLGLLGLGMSRRKRA